MYASTGSTQDDQIVDFKTTPDEVFEISIPQRANIILDNAAGTTTIREQT
jgi:hypothetical protein